MSDDKFELDNPTPAARVASAALSDAIVDLINQHVVGMSIDDREYVTRMGGAIPAMAMSVGVMRALAKKKLKREVGQDESTRALLNYFAHQLLELPRKPN